MASESVKAKIVSSREACNTVTNLTENTNVNVNLDISNASQSVPLLGVSMKVLNNRDIIGYSNLPGLLSSQTSDENKHSELNVSELNKISGENDLDSDSLPNELNKSSDYYKRKRTHHDYKTLSKPGCVGDIGKLYSSPDLLSISENKIVSSISKPSEDKSDDIDNGGKCLLL